jgi:hypothetical protein
MQQNSQFYSFTFMIFDDGGSTSDEIDHHFTAQPVQDLKYACKFFSELGKNSDGIFFKTPRRRLILQVAKWV